MIKGNTPGKLLSGYLILILVLFAEVAVASTAGPGGGSGLQWETPIQAIVRSFSGPVAYGFAVLALLGIGVKYSIGGDFGDMSRTALNVVIVISILMFAVPMLGTLWTGAVIP